MEIGARNWNLRDLHPQGHLNAFSSLGLGAPHYSPAVALGSQSGPDGEIARTATRGQCRPIHGPWDGHAVFVSRLYGSFRWNQCVNALVCTTTVRVYYFVCLWMQDLATPVGVCGCPFGAHRGPLIPTPGKSVFITGRVPGKDREDHSLTLCLILTL